MSIQLADGEWELDGVLAGSTRDHDIVVLDAAPGNPVWNNNDRDTPGSEYRRFGRDTEHGPTWTFEFLITTDNETTALQALAELRAAWTARADARIAGAQQALRYQVAGRTRRIYGRPRGFAPSDWGGLEQGIIVATAQFVTADPYHYDDETRSTSLTVFAAPSSGFIFPVTFPFTTTAGGPRQGVIADTGGTVPTPARITFYGPNTDPQLTGDGWKVGLRTTIAHDQSVTIDSRNKTIEHSAGGIVPLAPGTWLRDVRLRPGSEDLLFTGADPTGTARVTVEWNPAHDSL